jgi:hypothetical protein
LERLDLLRELGTGRGRRAGLADQPGDFLGGHLLRVAFGGRGGLVGAEVDPVLEVGERDLVVGQERRAPHPLAVDPRAVGAAQVA